MKFNISVFDKDISKIRYHNINLKNVSVDDFFYFLDSFSNFINKNVYICDYRKIFGEVDDDG